MVKVIEGGSVLNTHLGHLHFPKQPAENYHANRRPTNAYIVPLGSP